jgi:hypothetical protein
MRGSLLDLATALFAFAAAIFWFLAASDAHRQAIEHSAWLNSVAAALSGCAALFAFFKAAGDWWD